MSADNLRLLWLEACAPYQVRDSQGQVKTERMEDGHEEPVIEQSRMANDLTIFVIKNRLNNERPIIMSNIQYWRRIGRVTNRIESTIRT